jgi:hypothetical protein
MPQRRGTDANNTLMSDAHVAAFSDARVHSKAPRFHLHGRAPRGDRNTGPVSRPREPPPLSAAPRLRARQHARAHTEL